MDQNINMGKPRILLLSDDLRMTSGISTMSREFVMGTMDKFNWVQLGAGINHHEAGKFVDVNEDVRQKTGIKDAELKIIPYNSYGDIIMLRKIACNATNSAAIDFKGNVYVWGAGKYGLLGNPKQKNNIFLKIEKLFHLKKLKFKISFFFSKIICFALSNIILFFRISDIFFLS